MFSFQRAISSVIVTRIIVYRVSTTISTIKYFQFTRSKLELIRLFSERLLYHNTIGVIKQQKVFSIFSNGIKKDRKDISVFRLATSYSHRDKVPTTIGAEKLNFRVRYGNGCDLLAIAARLFYFEVSFPQN